MWYEYIDHVIFLKDLYRQVPELVHVRIYKISLEDEGTKVAIVFDMPKFADNIPEKWHKLAYNSLSIEVDFWCIYDFQMSSDHSLMTGDISITKEDDLIHVFIKGTVNCQFKAEVGLIQKVSGYINTEVE